MSGFRAREAGPDPCARISHNPEVAGSNPAPATSVVAGQRPVPGDPGTGFLRGCPQDVADIGRRRTAANGGRPLGWVPWARFRRCSASCLNSGDVHLRVCCSRRATALLLPSARRRFLRRRRRWLRSPSPIGEGQGPPVDPARRRWWQPQRVQSGASRLDIPRVAPHGVVRASDPLASEPDRTGQRFALLTRTCVTSVPLCVKSAVSAPWSVRRCLSPSRSFVRWGAAP